MGRNVLLILTVLICTQFAAFSQLAAIKSIAQTKNLKPAVEIISNTGSKHVFKIQKDPTSPGRINPRLTEKTSETQPFSKSKKNVPNLATEKKQEEFKSVDGYDVAFEIPSIGKKTGACATPLPVIKNADSKMVNCPFVVACDDPVNRDANIPSISDPTLFFKLNWTVFLNGGAPTNINQGQVDLLMTELNNDFNNWNIQFCANPATFVEDGTYFTLNAGSEDAAMKTTYGVTPTDVINIYVVNNITNPNAGGYARFPYDPWGGTDIHGGVVMSQGNSVLGTHTLAHELGHTFGLHHTFHGVDEVTICSSCYEPVGNVSGAPQDGETDGDRCSDTNPHPTNAYNCSDPTSSVNGCDAFPWNNTPVDNHMSYSFCTNTFTPQQAGRMHCMINTYLTDWVNFGGATCGSLPPVPNFVGSPQIWQAPANVSFTDYSVPGSTISSWIWDFDVANLGGVAPATFNGQAPPVVLYNNPGFYTVSLTVTNANGFQTETKTNYIEVLAPAGDCDTLDTQWLNPTPTPTIYSFGPGDFFSGVPAPTYNGGGPTALGMYERFFTPNPGTTKVGAARIGLAELFDPDDDMVIQVSVYQDLAGAPNFGAGALGGSFAYSPTFDLGVPPAGSTTYIEIWIPFLNAVTIPTGTFHVGVEIFQGDASDELLLITTCDGPPGCAPPTGQGEGDNSNHVLTNIYGLLNYNIDIGSNLDLDIVPMLGEYQPIPILEGYLEDVNCDTTFVAIFDTAFYSTPVSWEFLFSDGSVYSSATDPEILLKTYLQAGPDTVIITAINECGRVGQTSWIIPYNFLSTPQAEFDKDLANPSCMGPPGITFTSSTVNMANYLWDFGDGTTLNSGTNPIVNHTYGTVGSYFVNLTVTSPGYLPLDTIYLENFNSGIPGGFTILNNDGLNSFYPPFTTSGWLALDIDGTGDLEALSTSWYTPAGTSDDWLITPLIPLNASSSLYWDAEATDVNFPDGYEVRISATTPTIAAFMANPVLFSVGAENTFSTSRNVNLEAAGYASQNVYLAFRNNSNDQNLLSIDNIVVGTTSFGCKDFELKLDFVEIVDCSVVAPNANFIVSPLTGCAGAPMAFTDLSTGSPDPATSWLWNFNDGGFSTLQNPTHTYVLPGVYNVKLIAYNAGGSDTLSASVTVIDCGPLPIELIYFNGENRDDYNHLYWATASETESDYFSLYRKYENDFVLLANIEAANNSVHQINYEWNDLNPLPGINYYRLDQTDLNGELSFSGIIAINTTGNGEVQIFPNPASSEIYIVWEDASFEYIEVRNALGQILFSEKINSKQSLFLNVLNWNPGMYYCSFSGKRETITKSVIIY